MTDNTSLEKRDSNVLLWIVGSRRGASFEEIVDHECAHHRRHPPTEDELRESLSRLEAKELIWRNGDRYEAKHELQEAFLNECRNCRDTFEETDVLQRMIASLQ